VVKYSANGAPRGRASFSSEKVLAFVREASMCVEVRGPITAEGCHSPDDCSDPGLASVTNWSISGSETRKGFKMTTKLTDAEFGMLSAAMTRDDKSVSLPAKLSGARLRNARDKLIEAGFVREVKAKASSPVWRRDDEGDAAYSLKLTTAGVKAAREFEETAALAPTQSEPSKVWKPAATPARSARLAAAAQPQQGIAAPASAMASQGLRGAPRSGSKIAAVIALLESTTGATITELITATGWLPHTTRAALTGLRKRGYKITLDRPVGKNQSIYRIESQSCKPQPTAGALGVEAR
jgi:Protein of unknown function (DUF3489)